MDRIAKLDLVKVPLFILPRLESMLASESKVSLRTSQLVVDTSCFAYVHNVRLCIFAILESSFATFFWHGIINIKNVLHSTMYIHLGFLFTMEY